MTSRVASPAAAVTGLPPKVEAPGRVYPGKFGGEYLIKLGKELREEGFCKNATVECCFDNFEIEGPEALRFVKEKML